MEQQPVWFITGASKGLGLSLVKQVYNQGYLVAATSRNADELTEAVGYTDSRFLPLAVDLRSEASVEAAIEETIRRFGRIDVVVNNAGYGLVGSIEELTAEEVRANFDINVFGALHVIRKAMPYLRKQQAGRIVNISSIGGFFAGFPGWAIYCATKFAVEGFSEALAAEAKEFGIKVTSVAPGYFRTHFLTSGSMNVPQQPIEAYREVRESQNRHRNELNGHQPGDPEKAAAAIVRMASEPNPPLHLFLGQDAYELANGKIGALQRDLETWKELTVSTGFSEKATPDYLGVWVTKDGYIRQELLPGGRYDEARGAKKSAYTGRYTIEGDHIEYIDDTGFTASGDFRDGVLYHGGYVFYPENQPEQLPPKTRKKPTSAP